MVTKADPNSRATGTLSSRVPLDYLKKMLEQAERAYPIGSTWRHYKGKEFVVTGFDISEQTNDIYVRFAYPEDVVKIIPNARHDSWGDPVPAAIAEAEFSLNIQLWEEQVETEDFAGPRFTRIGA